MHNKINVTNTTLTNLYIKLLVFKALDHRNTFVHPAMRYVCQPFEESRITVLILHMISTLFRRPWIRTCGYWLFAIGMGTILLLIEDVDDNEPMFSILAFIYWSLLIYWGARWIFDQIKSVIKQRKEKINLELMHLKSQVSPHFFFNTLNNLYGLIDKDSAQAKQMVLTLSEMMRYSIYDGQKEWVPLEDELKYISNYIDLHKARYYRVSDIRLHHAIKQPGITVTPLLFIILLENAFKHGIETLRENAFVHVELTADVHSIHFSIKNNYDPTCRTGNDGQGIGLRNLARRLELVYPGRHSLTWSTNADIYSAKLTLQTK
jgi:two-component system sensor histidine kinase AlgZ